MSEISFRAPPMKRSEIRHIAQKFRDLCQMSDTPYADVVRLLEADILRLVGFDWEVVGQEELVDEHGLTLLNERFVQIREDVYEGAIKGSGRDRMTIAHEMGHAILHSDVQLARMAPGAEKPKPFRCTEWQAKCFAGEFLVDIRQINNPITSHQIAQEFGVSHQAALVQLGTFTREGTITCSNGWYYKSNKAQKFGGNQTTGPY